jgi:hypothetical protein
MLQAIMGLLTRGTEIYVIHIQSASLVLTSSAIFSYFSHTDTTKPSSPPGYYTYHLLQHKTVYLAHTVYLFVSRNSQNE